MALQFLETMALAKGKKEVQAICKDLFSESEMIMFIRRIQVASLLREGWTAERIAQELKASASLIQQVKGSLIKDGQGYQLVIKRLKS